MLGCRKKIAVLRGALTAVAIVVLTAFALAPTSALSQSVRQPAAVAAVPTTINAEIMLIEVYKDLGKHNLRGALEKADRLVAAYPTFRLGHLIRGDLLTMQTRPVTSLGPQHAPKEPLDNLRAEAAMRLRFITERPDPNLVPRQILSLRNDQKHALIVDAKRSRLFVYQNVGGSLKFVTDYYVSQGKYGVHKLREGDQRTPIGVYYITGNIPGPKLPDFYGPGALPINYPNEWDRLHGRGGSGIWLHGTPSDSYSRPPLSSDGCVVLTNPDLRSLTQLVEVGKTPVIIAESIDFISKTKWEQNRQLAKRLVDGWRIDVESASLARIKSNYANEFKSERGENLNAWFGRQRFIPNGAQNARIAMKDETHFFYPEKENLIVSTFTMESLAGNSKSSVRKRQYWTKEGAQWKIIYELTL